MKNCLKCLQLPILFHGHKDWWKCTLKEQDRITPRLNRDGYYFDRLKNEAWIEVSGEAWLYGNGKKFQHDLDSCGDVRLSNELYHALELIFAYGVATHRSEPELYRKFLIENELRQIRGTRVNIRKFVLGKISKIRLGKH